VEPAGNGNDAVVDGAMGVGVVFEC
jgi:hypothetical protein